MTESFLLKLAQYIISSAVSGVIGDAAYDALKGWWRDREPESLENIYVAEFIKAANSLEPALLHHVEKGENISIDKDLLYRILAQDAPSMPLVEGAVQRLLDSLADRLVKGQVISIPGHQLTDMEYKGLTLEVLQRTWEKINQGISDNGPLFQEYVHQSAQLTHLKDDEILSALDQTSKNLDELISIESEILKRELSRLSKENQQILSLLLRPDSKKESPLTIGSLKVICNNQIIHNIRQAVGQYLHERYVYRIDVESQFRFKFLQSSKPCYLILGRAGEGKTNLMCHLAEINSPSLLFLSGREFTYNASIEDHVLEIILGRESNLSFPALVMLVDQILQENDTHLLVFIDAINDNLDPIDLNKAISSLIVNISKSRIKLVLSCRDTDWSHFHENDVLRQGLFNPIQGSLNLRTIDKASIALFSDTELEAAWKIYKTFYQLEGNLTDDLQNLCRDPFMLYLLGEAYSNRDISKDDNAYVLPESTTRLQMFDKYWDRKFPGHQKPLQHAVYSLAKNRREKSMSSEFTSFEIIDLLRNFPDPYKIYHSLLSEKILVATGEESAKFTYDLVLEYSSARQYIFQQHSLDRKSDEQIIKLLSQYSSKYTGSSASGYSSMLNIVNFILEILVIDYGRSALFSKIFESNLRDQFLVSLCAVIEQLPSIEEGEIFAVLELISLDAHPSDIQFILARTLGGVRKKKSQTLAMKLLSNLAISEEDIIRLEVIGTLEKLGKSLPGEAIDVLLKMIDDSEIESIRPTARNLFWKMFFDLDKSEQSNMLKKFAQSTSEYVRSSTNRFIIVSDHPISMEQLIHSGKDEDLYFRKKALDTFWQRATKLSGDTLLYLLPQIIPAMKSHSQSELRYYIKLFLNSLILENQCSNLLPLLQKGDLESRGVFKEIISEIKGEATSMDFIIIKLQSYSAYPVADLLARAMTFAESIFENRELYSGVKVLDFLFEVVTIIVDLELDPSLAIAAMLIGDMMPEVNQKYKDEIIRQFGEDIYKITERAIRLRQIEPLLLKDNDYLIVAEMCYAIAEDFRSMVLILICRLVRLSKIGDTGDLEMQAIANSTIKIYVQIASNLGLRKLKEALEDEAFSCLSPDNFIRIKNLVTQAGKEIQRSLVEIENKLKSLLEEDVPFFIVEHQPDIFQIHKYSQNDLSVNMSDYHTTILVTNSVVNCYKLLSALHSVFIPDPHEFDDFILAPIINLQKRTYYQSLHTSIISFDRRKARFLIRTKDMHQQALEDFDYRFIEGAVLVPQELQKDEKYINRIQESIYVFTSGLTGGILRLPHGSTPIDFAYNIHTELGHRCRGARVNGKLVPLYQELKTGDQVEILTAKRGGPSRDWLNPSLGLVHTQRARSKIKFWFKKQEDVHNLAQGRETLERELQRLGLSEVNFEKLARDLGFKNPDDMFIELGNGHLPFNKIIKQFAQNEEISDIFEVNLSAAPITSTNAIEVVGLKGMLSSVAKCCNPIPGDDVVGFVTRGRGATIHRKDCPNILKIKDRDRLLQVGWGHVERTYPIPIKIKAYDRQGLVRDISDLLADENINIADVKVNVNRSIADLRIIIEVKDLTQLSRILARIEHLPNVMEAHRINPG